MTKKPTIYTNLGVAKKQVKSKEKITKKKGKIGSDFKVADFVPPVIVYRHPEPPKEYDYVASMEYCRKLGLVWLGGQHADLAAHAAYCHHFTQAQFDAAMRQHLEQVKWLFTPKNYTRKQRVLLAIWFLFGKFKG